MYERSELWFRCSVVRQNIDSGSVWMIPLARVNSSLSWPAHQLEEFLQETRWSDCRYRAFLKCAGLVFKSQKRNRIAKFDVAWSYNTAESQHAKGLPFLSGACSINLKLMKQHAMTSVLMSQTPLPKSGPQDAPEIRIQAPWMAALATTNEYARVIRNPGSSKDKLVRFSSAEGTCSPMKVLMDRS
jgi:hypothetical protein